MKRTALYSSARSRALASETAASPAAPEQPTALTRRARLGGWLARHKRLGLVLGVALVALVGVQLERARTAPLQPITQSDIDRAVRLSLENKPLPSQAAKAFETIRPSVVRVMGLDHPQATGTEAKPPARSRNPQEKSAEQNASIGTGVVITESGSILTNLHVVHGASRIKVVFADGTESDAVITGVDADNDLAVLQARKQPDDLQPATLVTTGDLRAGDQVVAVGFPFGFGPSVSAGVVSGLKREFRSADGTQVLGNLIQFDAAANPGNSGGPLVNMEGEVLGIVTAILNPVQQHFFVGLAFAVPIENAASAVGLSPF